jgi:TRAP-type mannitol/chloroaromatic compound transport system substrate-binding protein
MKKVTYGCLVAFSVALLISGSIPLSAAAAEPVEFKCAAFCPVHELTVKQWWEGMEMINKEFEGEVLFKLLGGPEVVPAFELHGATMKGVFDVAFVPPSYYRGKLPEAEIADYTDSGWNEIVKNGFLEDNRKMHEKLGLFYLIDSHVGVGEGRTYFYIFTNVSAKNPEDLAGKKIRVFPAISPFIKALGADPILMSPSDIYMALERGVIDGFVDINVGIVDDYHYQEICEYFIPHGFYHTAISVLINSKSWNRLSKDLQDRITGFTETEVVKTWQEYFNRTNPAETKKIIDAGIKPISFSEDQKEKYLTTAYRSAWESVEKEAPGFIEKYGDKYWLHYK